jgi:hypothetical protein
MSLRSIFRFTILFLLFGLVASCNKETEETTEVFKYKYFPIGTTKAQADKLSHHVVKEYQSFFEDYAYHIKGKSDPIDSIYIKLGVVPGKELMVGEYVISPENDLFEVIHYSGDEVAKMKTGTITITYVNRRIDFTIEGVMNNGLEIGYSSFDNLLLDTEGVKTLNGTTQPSNPTTPPGGGGGGTDPSRLLKGTFDGENYQWENNELSSLYNSLSGVEYLSLVCNDQARVFNLSFPKTVSDGFTVGKTYTLAGGDVNASYTKDITGTPKQYGVNSFELTITSKNITNNTIDFTFKGTLVHPTSGSSALNNGIAKAFPLP